MIYRLPIAIASFVAIIASSASAAIHPDTKPALIRPEIAKEALQGEARCMEAITRQRFSVGKDGKLRKLGNMMISIIPCR